MQKPNRYVFETELEGFINVYQDSGKYENRTFSYKIPEDILTKIEKDRKELLKRGENGILAKLMSKYCYGLIKVG